LERPERLVASPLLQKRSPKRREKERLRLAPDRTRKPFNCVIELLGMNAQQTHEVQRVGVLRVARQHLLATQLGLDMPAGMQVIAAGFIKLNHAVGGALAGFFTLESRLNLATVHCATSISIPIEQVSDSRSGRKNPVFHIFRLHALRYARRYVPSITGS